MSNDETSPVHLGQRIRQLRQERGWTIEQYAEKIRTAGGGDGLSVSQLQKLETGAIQDPHLGTVEKCAKGLGMDLVDLLRERGPEPPVQTDDAVTALARALDGAVLQDAPLPLQEAAAYVRAAATPDEYQRRLRFIEYLLRAPK